MNITIGRNVKYWIIGNEPDLNNSSQPNPVSVSGVETYIKAFASAMKAVDPSILTVGPENASYGGDYYPALVGGANDITGTIAPQSTHLYSLDANGNVLAQLTYASGDAPRQQLSTW